MLHNTDDWICYYTQPHRERLAEASLRENGYEVFLPLCVKLVQRRGRYVQSIRTLFSRYIFARGGKDLAGSKRFNGITSFAGASLERSRISDCVIDGIKARQDERGIIPVKSDAFKSGQSIKIVLGQFMGLEAIFSEVDDSKRSFILLELLGKTHRVRVMNTAIDVAA